MKGRPFVHEQPEGYGHEPYPNQPQGQGGYPPQQPQYPGQQPGQEYGRQPPPYGAQQPPPGGGPWGQTQPSGWGPQDPMGPGGWGPPPGPPQKGNSGPLIAVAAVAALVLLGGGGAIVWALSGNGDKPSHPVAVSAPPTTAPTFPDPSGLPSVPAFPTPSVPDFPTPTGSPTLDESMFVQAGDCVRITGKAPDLKMFKADCGNAPYKVLKRYSGTSDRNKCRSVPGYTTAFWAKSKKYSFLSYVLCLKHQ
jgi:hypothetical protein